MGSGRNWGVFDFCNQFLQAEDAIAEAVGDLCARLRVEHNVRYAEIRFCPALHTTEGLSEERVVEAAIRGYYYRAGRKSGSQVARIVQTT